VTRPPQPRDIPRGLPKSDCGPKEAQNIGERFPNCAKKLNHLDQLQTHHLQLVQIIFSQLYIISKLSSSPTTIRSKQAKRGLRLARFARRRGRLLRERPEDVDSNEDGRADHARTSRPEAGRTANPAASMLGIRCGVQLMMRLVIQWTSACNSNAGSRETR